VKNLLLTKMLPIGK